MGIFQGLASISYAPEVPIFLFSLLFIPSMKVTHSVLSKTRFIDNRICRGSAALLGHAGKSIFHICFIQGVKVFIVLYQKKFDFIMNAYILFCQTVKTIFYYSALAAGNLRG